MTVGLGKTRNSTNGPERIHFTPGMNAASTVVENRGQVKENTPTQCMDLVTLQTQVMVTRNLLRSGGSTYPLERILVILRKDLMHIFLHQFKENSQANIK